MQNQAWARMISAQKTSMPTLRKGIVTHSTIDNNDGRQETWTGLGTTHDTNKTIFQVATPEEQKCIPVIGTLERPLDLAEPQSQPLVPSNYHPGKRVEPPLFPSHVDQKSREILDSCLDRDIAWSMAGAIKSDDEELPLLGSWTPFNKMTTDHVTTACIQEFLPVTPHPPEYPVCKDYLDFLLEVVQELEIPHIFVHSDEMVYSKLCDILWKNPQIYKAVILLMGGFHQLRVMQRLLYKRYSCRGLKDWFIDAGIIASGSIDQALEGRHYYRSMRLHKECFDALVQFRFECLTGSVTFLFISIVLKSH
ncbi:MAG: hypothetical protein CMB97_00010 [Flavobacteriaceae bacterium]|nr:hypothetical protein [Flavobacteriaceae bacterium]